MVAALAVGDVPDLALDLFCEAERRPDDAAVELGECDLMATSSAARPARRVGSA
jgi:hypothetical protein